MGPGRDRPGSTMSVAMAMRNLSGPAQTVASTSAIRHVGITNMTLAYIAQDEVKLDAYYFPCGS